MNKKTVTRSALLLWQFRAALLGFAACFAWSVLFSELVFWRSVLLISTAVAVLFFICVYYPLKKLKLSYFIYGGQLVVDGGVFYNRRRVIPLENIQYISTLQTPDMVPFGLTSVIVHSVGSSLYLPCLKKAEALNLQEYCARRKR